MILLFWLTIIIIAYEVYKFINIEKEVDRFYYEYKRETNKEPLEYENFKGKIKASIKRRIGMMKSYKYRGHQILGHIYLFYMVYLIFFDYWFVSFMLIMISYLTGRNGEKIINKKENQSLQSTLKLDNILTILLLIMLLLIYYETIKF